MSIRSIPREEWPAFCQALAERQRGSPVKFEASGPAGILHTEAAAGRLVDVAADIGDVRERDVIRIAVAEDGVTKSCAIGFLLDVQLEETPGGADAALFVEAAEESAILRFRSANVPGMVDGV